MILGFLKKALNRQKSGILKRIAMGAEMNDFAMLHGAEPREILQTVIDESATAIMSYLSKGKWHVAKVLLTELGANRVKVRISPRKKPHPINIQVDQPVGVSLKYGYGKFIFESKVVGFEPSQDTSSGGTVLLAVPDRIEIVQRRSYFRVEVPNSLKVQVLFWHRGQPSEKGQVPSENYYQGKLVDISAGGAQIALDTGQKPDFRPGQFIAMRFTPLPYETPLLFDCQIRNILPTVDDRNICLGLQIVGLEASPEGREILQRLCNVVEQYYQLNQSNAKQRDFQPIKPTTENTC